MRVIQLRQRPWRTSLLALLLVSGLLVAPAFANHAAAKPHLIHSLNRALIVYSDLPPRPTTEQYPTAFAFHHVYRHYNAKMLAGFSEPYCFPNKRLAHLGWKQGIAEFISDTSSGGWTMCAFLFDSDQHARLAYAAVLSPIVSALKTIPGSLRLALPRHLGQERVGVTGPDLDNAQVNFLHDNAVIELKAPVDGAGFHYRLARIAVAVNSRLR